MKERETIIHHYIQAYNRFDIDAMITDFDADIRFENISDKETNLSLSGLSAFKHQAEEAATLFAERQQNILSFKHFPDKTAIEIEYHAILKTDLPNGMKKGDVLNLMGKSVFTFNDQNKVTVLTDIS